ncbi:MAG TPA: transglycosylase domain-containing protein [Thermoleophilaceae bacterium]|nr:transglycosylase domain-containing protein [Thermoleophilaceae bacterium]
MTYRDRKHKRGSRRTGRSKALLGLGVVALMLAVAGLSVVGYVLAIAASAPDIDELRPANKGETSVIYASDGTRLGYVQSDIARTVIAWRSMPRHVRQATVAIEDERYYQHKGVDINAIVRASVKNIESGKNVQGGSTITQQLVRALYIKDPKRNFERKIREAKLASELEERHSKRWILHNYLNSVPYGTVGGRTAIGIEAAAVTFFSKKARNLELHESAMLAGLPQAPSQYNPFRNPTSALERRNEVLRKMAELRYITRAEAAEASQKPLGLKRGTRYTARREPYFFDYVQEQLLEKYGVGVFRAGGLKVHTTIDPGKQDQARKAIFGQLPNPADPASAIVSVDPANGHIRAMASSGTYKDRTFNLAAQGHRQPGSAFKTMVLVAAIRKGIDPTRTSYVSKPIDIKSGPYGPWKVKTYGNTYGGSMNLVRATVTSDNTVYAQLILDIGPKSVCETARLIGITTKLDCYPAEGLGGLRLGVSPLEMANAYATLASGGIRNKPKAIRKVEFPDGKSEDLGKPERKRVLTDGQAYEVTKILKQNVTGGTGTRAIIGCPAAGKTGTTDNFNDAWFVGYTPKLSTATWVGHPNALTSMPGVAGGTIPAGIWHDYMVVAKGNDCSDFPMPKEPARFTPFFGKFSSTGGRGTGGYYSSESSGSQDAPATPGADTGGEGNGEFDPRLYESPPQEAPDTQPEPAPAEPPSDGGGGGGGGSGPSGGSGPGPDG